MQDTYNAASWLVDRHVASDRGQRVAIVSGDDRLTYADLQGLVWRVQHALEGLDVRSEERVVMVVNDEPAFPAWFLGCLRSGAVPVPLSTMLRGDELGTIVDDAVARVVVLSAAYADHLPLLAKRAPHLRAAVIIGGMATASAVEVHDWAEFTDDSEASTAATRADSPAFWLYSSGTTGVPKGVMHRHASLEATAATYARTVLRVTPADRCFSMAKLFFAYGLGNSLTFPFSVGATAILSPDRPTPVGVAAQLQQHQPTLFFASPGFVAAMLDADIPVGALSSVRLAVTAGEALPAELYRRFTSRFGVPVLDGIGSTEALHIFLSNHVGSERPGTSGTPVAGYDVKLLDDSGLEVTAPAVPGYLHVRGPSLATGYWCRTDATQAAFFGQWLRTGDVYSRSEDGGWTFHGRNSDMIKVGGIWVSPAEVESVLIEHPDILEAAVVGSHTADGLETAVAFVVARSGHVIDVATIETHCRSRMAAFKRPRRIIVIDELPKTATGKVRRFALRNQLSDASGPPVER